MHAIVIQDIYLPHNRTQVKYVKAIIIMEYRSI